MQSLWGHHVTWPSLATPLPSNTHQTHTRHFTPHPEQKIDEQEAPHSEQVTVIYRLVRSVQSRPINYFFLLSLSHYSAFSFFFTLSGIWGGGWAHLHTGSGLNRLLSCSFFLILTVSVAVCPSWRPSQSLEHLVSIHSSHANTQQTTLPLGPVPAWLSWMNSLSCTRQRISFPFVSLQPASLLILFHVRFYNYTVTSQLNFSLYGTKQFQRFSI